MRDRTEQLEWEARAGRHAAVAAWIAAALIVGSLVFQGSVLERTDDAREFARILQDDQGSFLLWRALGALATLMMIPPLLYLAAVTRYRRPEMPAATRFLIILGLVGLAVCAVWIHFKQVSATDDFLTGANKSKKHAEDLLNDASLPVRAVGQGVSIAAGLGVILAAVHAMRAGILSRFMGVLGIILGAVFVLPLLPTPIIQLFWLVALGALFWGLWPGGGRGPAWESGEPIPWPSAQERFGPPPEDEEPEPEPEPETEQQPNPRAARKRKKKKARR